MLKRQDDERLQRSGDEKSAPSGLALPCCRYISIKVSALAPSWSALSRLTQASPSDTLIAVGNVIEGPATDPVRAFSADGGTAGS